MWNVTTAEGWGSRVGDAWVYNDHFVKGREIQNQDLDSGRLQHTDGELFYIVIPLQEGSIISECRETTDLIRVSLLLKFVNETEALMWRQYADSTTHKRGPALQTLAVGGLDDEELLSIT